VQLPTARNLPLCVDYSPAVRLFHAVRGRVPAGQFYVYLHEPLDRLKARVAGGRILPESKPETTRQAAPVSDPNASRTVTVPPGFSWPATPFPQSR
jgi:hypothetical protein